MPRDPQPQPEARNVTLPENARSTAPEKPRSDRWTHHNERADPEQRFFIYRLCDCEACGGRGHGDLETTTPGYSARPRCPVCRGEGRKLQLVATAPTPEAVGAAIVQLGREGEFGECPVGCLDTRAEEGERKWLISPWLPSPRNVSDAARLLAKSKGEK
jgi:hypothetical protein